MALSKRKKIAVYNRMLKSVDDVHDRFRDDLKIVMDDMGVKESVAISTGVYQVTHALRTILTNLKEELENEEKVDK